MVITVITKQQDAGGSWVPVARGQVDIKNEHDVAKFRGFGYPSTKVYFDTRGETEDLIAIEYKGDPR